MKMNLLRYLALGTVALSASTSPLLAIIALPPQPTDFKFQFLPSDPNANFTPTFIDILVPTGHLGIPLDDSAIVNYQITTPEGVWTPNGYTPNGGVETLSPSIFGGGVEVNLQDQLIFTGPVTIEVGQGGFQLLNAVPSIFDVELTTTSVSDTGEFTPAPADALPVQGGTWNLVSVPDTAEGWMLLLLAAAGLGVYGQYQNIRARNEARALVLIRK